MDELEHAEKFMKFQNQRGGKIILQDIIKPKKDAWDSGMSYLRKLYIAN